VVVSRGSGLTTRDRADRPSAPGRDRGERRPRRGGASSTGPVVALPARRRSARAARRRPLVWLAGVLALAALAAFLWAGPLLSVRAVRVDGAVGLPAAQVQEAAGVAEGTPLLQVDVDAAAARVARLPQVAHVQVTRGWPSTVVVTVTERTPLVVVEQAGRRTLVDVEGVLFDTITGAAPKGVVPLEVADPGPRDPSTRAALAAVAALPREVRVHVTRITAAGGPSALQLHMDDDTTVLWGDGSESRRKAEVLVALRQQIAGGEVDPARTIDVSAPGAVVLR
jgi:cell division protein FtsQ